MLSRLTLPTLLITGISFMASGCGQDATGVDTAPNLHLSGMHSRGVEFNVIGDCTQAVLIDPGQVEVSDGNLFEQGVTFECLSSGDITGTVRAVRNSRLTNADASFTEWEGPTWGTTTITVESYYGRTDLVGTFHGPWKSDWQALVNGIGEGTSYRAGTGDFEGLAILSKLAFDPETFGALVNESGRIIEIHGSP